MTLYQYKALREEEQLEIVFAKAVQVAEREDDNASYVLYQLNAFYIELSLLNCSIQPEIRIFAATALLDPYLKDVNIDFR